MKILHTSDWHIGQIFKGESREEEHKKFFEWLRNVIEKENIDILIVAGDIFDVTNPSNSALKLYYDFLFSLKELNLKKVIIIGGNHDGISTLQTPKNILKFLDIEVISGEKEELQNYENIFNIEDEVLICAVPFLRDNIVRNSIEKEDVLDIEQSLKEGIINYYNTIFKKAKEINSDIPIIATGHFTILGSSISDSEREIYIGKLKGIEKNSFDMFDYVAMGHLHKFQEISKKIYYSGSPIPLSFSESNQEKKVIIFDTHSKTITQKIIPTFRNLYRIKGDFNYVIEEIKNIKEEMPPFIEVTLTDEFLTNIDEIKNIEAQAKILQINYDKENQDEIINIQNLEEQITPFKVFEEIIEQTNYKENKNILIDIFKKIEEDVRNEDN
jgi:exonuclease SbcD